MAEIVAAFGASHTPPMIQRPDVVPDEVREEIFGLYREMGRRLAEARPQALVIITNEHLHNFSLANFPAVCICMADRYESPSELWLKVEHSSVAGDAALGEYLYQAALENDFDPSFSMSFSLDHGTVTPLHLSQIDRELPIVPIVFNNVQPPYPTMRRCLQWGEFLGHALRAYEGLDRVAILATGGLSHDIGTPNMGALNEAFDREFLRLLADNPAELVRYSQAHVHEAGNGAEEVRNWVVGRGIVGDAPMDILYYAPVPNWYVGTAIVQWQVRVPSAVA